MATGDGSAAITLVVDDHLNKKGMYPMYILILPSLTALNHMNYSMNTWNLSAIEFQINC